MQNKDLGNTFIKKKKKEERRLKNGKSKTRKNQNSQESRKNYSEFSILPCSQTRKLRFKNLGIKFPRFLRCQRGSSLIVYKEWWVNHGAFCISLTWILEICQNLFQKDS